MDISKTGSNTPISNNALSQTSKQKESQGNKFQRELDRDALNVGEVAGRSQIVERDKFAYKILERGEKDRLESELLEKAKNFPKICEELKFIPITKYNIHFLNRFLNTKELNEDIEIIDNFEDYMDSIEDENSAKMADFLLTNKYVLNSPYLKSFIPFLIETSSNNEENKMIKEFINNRTLHSSLPKIELALGLINDIGNSPERADIVQKIFNNADFWDEKVIGDDTHIECLKMILKNVIKNKPDDNYSYKLAKEIFSDKKLFSNSNVINLVNATQVTYEDLPDKYLDLKNEYLHNLLETPEIFENPELYIAAISSTDAIVSKETAKTLSEIRVLEFIVDKSKGNKYKVQADMGENVFNMVITPRGGNTEVIRFRVGEDIEILSETQYSKDIDQHRKNMANGEYIVSKHSKDGSFRKTLYDSDGIQKYSEVVKKDEETGQYSITGYRRGLNKNMKAEILSSLEFKGEDKSNRTVERNFETANGTKLEYELKSSPKKSQMGYNIVDKDGNELFSIKRSFKRIDENHSVSTLNEDKYETSIDPKGLIIVTKTDKNGNKETVRLTSINLDFNLIGIYRKLPGDTLFQLAKYNIRTVMGGEADKNNACYIRALSREEIRNATNYLYVRDQRLGNTICVDENIKNDGFGFIHELGHALDSNNNLLKKFKNELMTIFRKEYSEYQSVSSIQENDSIDYFTELNDRTRFIDDALQEIIAESYAMSSGLMPEDKDTINDRGIILQKYFPETMAFVTSKLYGTNQPN